MLLKDKNVIITGATRGIGKGIALEFAKQGANIAFTYSRSVDEAKDCLLYTSDAADDSLRVDLGGRRIIKKRKRCRI